MISYLLVKDNTSFKTMECFSSSNLPTMDKTKSKASCPFSYENYIKYFNFKIETWRNSHIFLIVILLKDTPYSGGENRITNYKTLKHT